MNIDVDKIVVSLDVVTPDAVVVEASAVAPSGIVTEAVAKLPTQVIVISHEETPTVTPLQIVDYGNSSIECAFDVTTEQAEEVVRGVLCGTTNPPTFENADYRLLHGQGSMDLAFAGLHRNTEYYLRPYALSNLGYKYGDVVAQRTKANPIPDEYQLVEWLDNNGTAYCILPAISPDNSYSMYVEFTPKTQTSSLGGLLGQATGRRFGLGFPSNHLTILANGTWQQPSGYNLSTSSVNKVLMTSDKVILRIASSVVERDFSLNFGGLDNIGVFCLLVNGVVEPPQRCIIYTAYIKKENDFIYNIFPVYRKSDSKPGMYDIVGNQFYTNQGTGEFTVGPDKEWEE